MTAVRLAAARRFLHERARPLEAALFRFHFEGAPPGDVVRELAAFRNDDGGFGRALEPDQRAPESSAICTSVALQVLREVGAVRDGDLAEGAASYLVRTLDRARCTWRNVPPSAEASPHAPWWNQAGRDAHYDEFSLNPTAELLGYLHERRAGVPRDVLHDVGGAVVRAVEAAEEMEMHGLLCCLRLFATPELPSPLRDTLARRLPGLVTRTVERDPVRWAEYGLRPLQVVEGPDSPFLPGLEAHVQRNLDFEVASQQPDGSWSPTWTWGDAYPDVWPTAFVEWSGVLTMQRLVVLRRHGRIPR